MSPAVRRLYRADLVLATAIATVALLFVGVAFLPGSEDVTHGGAHATLGGFLLLPEAVAFAAAAVVTRYRPPCAGLRSSCPSRWPPRSSRSRALRCDVFKRQPLDAPWPPVESARRTGGTGI